MVRHFHVRHFQRPGTVKLADDRFVVFVGLNVQIPIKDDFNMKIIAHQ